MTFGIPTAVKPILRYSWSVESLKPVCADRYEDYLVQHHVATKLAILTAHVLLGLSLLVFGYAAKNYFGLKAIVPGIEAVSPVTADTTARIISQQLPESDAGNSARGLAQRQANQLHTLHENWLAHMQFHVIYARNQLIAWALLSTLAFGLVIILHVRPKNVD